MRRKAQAPVPRLTPEERAILLHEEPNRKPHFTNRQCEHCGGLHARACPRVARMRFSSSNGKLIEVEFWADGQWDDSNVIWPEDVFGFDDE